MNIFKVLASGSGSINEPNVSAFLGFLLNPKEDHGLGDAFLRKVLKPLLAENDNLEFMRERDLSIHSNFEFEVLLEQAFKNDKDKTDKGNQIVDIVILCYEKQVQQGRFLADDIIKQKKEGQPTPKHIFLIENKINDGSSTDGQLKKQYEQTITKLGDLGIKTPEKLVSVIYVTPDGKNCNKEFSGFKDTPNKIHLFWDKEDDDYSISEIIREIIEEGSQPIDAYCQYTLQAFLEFVENDFKSTLKEEFERKKERENPVYKYGEKNYSRPKLAEKIIENYVSDYYTKHNKKITLDELNKAFPVEKTTGSKEYPPFAEYDHAKEKGSVRRDGTKIRDFFNYYNKSIKIADTEIYVRNGWDAKQLNSLLAIVGLQINDEDEVTE